ncbi:hypothetical protein TgHK011_005782 [Trichoderma gracile]|nr:hypothetical protein TgHK011_005782 [Trichoderma gracile]
MPTTRRRPVKSQSSSSSQPDSAHVNENGPPDADPEQSAAAETEIHAQSVEESTQLATAVLAQTSAEELPKAASARAAEDSGEPTELNTNTPKQAVEELTQLASTLPQGSLKDSAKPASSRSRESLKESTQQPTNSALRFLASPDPLDERRLTKPDALQTKKSDVRDLEEVTRQLLNNAALSLPDARLVIAYTRYAIPEDAVKNSAMVCMQRIPGRGDMFGVVQTSTHASFPISFPFHRRSTDERSKDIEQTQLDCKILYDPTSDDCLVLNRTKIDIYVTYLGLRTTRTRLVKGQSGIVSPGICTISVNTGEREGFTENRLVEFLLLRRRFTVSIHGAIDPPPSARVAIGQDGGDGRATKRQKLSDGKMETRVTQATDASLEKSLTAADRGLLSAPRQIRNKAVAPILDLTDGETALIEAPEFTVANAVDTYQLKRTEQISRTRAAGVFACRHSGLSEALVVAKILCCQNNPPILGLPDALDLWLRETTILENITHGVDARFLALYLEHLPPSLRRSPRSPPIEPSDARAILRDASSALAYLARRGIVHHDVKPGNITWSADRGAVLIDFGMAALVTDPQRMGGSPHYFPPEYVDEKINSRGPPGDVWALGVTMLQILRKLPADPFGRHIDLRHLRDRRSRARAEFIDVLELIASTRRQLNLEDVVEKLIFRMLDPDHKERILAADIELALGSRHALTGSTDDRDGI